MKKEVIIVPMDKSPLDVLSEMKEQTKSAWIYLHRNAVEKLPFADKHSIHLDYEEFCWGSGDAFTCIWIESESDSDKVWWEIYHISANNIAFKYAADDPDYIFFLKMEN